MDYSKYSNFLKNILENDRSELLSLYDKINSYKCMINIIKEFEIKYEFKDIWYNIWKGKIGDENNHYSSFYELPTKEFIECLYIIFKEYKIDKIDEVCAGMGLLSYLLRKRFEKSNEKVKITASDSGVSNFTNVSLDIEKIIKKDVSDITLQWKKNIFPPDAVICCWPYDYLSDKNIKKNILAQFTELVKKNYIKIFIFTCDVRYTIFTEDLKKNTFEQIAVENNYTLITLPIYQMCYLDLVEYNTIKNLKTRSITYLLIRNDLPKIDIKKKLDKYLYNYKKINPKRIELLDLATVGRIPKWSVNLENINDINTMLEIIENYKNTKNSIPLWIPDMEKLIFWHSKFKNNMFPLEIKSTEKFIEYYNLLNDMDGNKIEELKEKNVIPQWITIEIIEKYFWIKFSLKDNDSDKNWDKDLNTLMKKYNDLKYKGSFLSNLFLNYS